MNAYFDEYSKIFRKNNLDVFCEQELSEKFRLLSQLLVEENGKYNLTAIKNESLILPLHFADCALGEFFLPRDARLLDVGCGAGFPTLPLAILREDLKITALDSTEKKLRFIDKVCAELGIKNVKTVSGRAEELAKDVRFRERYDAVTARAVSRLNILSELCLPFLRKNGVFVAMKGAIGAEEAAEAEHGIGVLGGKIEDIREKKLYVGEGEMQDRVFVLVRKIEKTPLAYPRMYSKITKSPL